TSVHGGSRPATIVATSDLVGSCMVDPIRADEPYPRALVASAARARKEFITLSEGDPISLTGTALTKAILLRLGTFYTTQYDTKELVGKRYIGAGCDFFVETIFFFLKATLASNNSALEVVGERAIERRRGSMRPDI